MRWETGRGYQRMIDDNLIVCTPVGMNVIENQLLYCWYARYSGLFWAPVELFDEPDPPPMFSYVDMATAAESTVNKPSVFDMSTGAVGVVTIGLMAAILSFD